MFLISPSTWFFNSPVITDSPSRRGHTAPLVLPRAETPFPCPLGRARFEQDRGVLGVQVADAEDERPEPPSGPATPWRFVAVVSLELMAIPGKEDLVPSASHSFDAGAAWAQLQESRRWGSSRVALGS